MNEVAISKNLYKIFLAAVKFTPITLIILQLIGTILNYFGITSLILNCVGGTSIIFIILLYLISYVFKFCYLYRIPLHYMTVIIVIKLSDAFINLPINSITLYRIYAVITGLFIVTFIYYMYKNRKSKKVDYIKELCQRYCDC